MSGLVEVGMRHHIESTSGHPDTWTTVDDGYPNRWLRGHVCDLLCHPVYAVDAPTLPGGER